jgi:hypothetical protein
MGGATQVGRGLPWEGMVLGFYHGTTTVGDDGSPKGCNCRHPLSKVKMNKSMRKCNKQTTEMSNPYRNLEIFINFF